MERVNKYLKITVACLTASQIESSTFRQRVMVRLGLFFLTEMCGWSSSVIIIVLLYVATSCFDYVSNEFHIVCSLLHLGKDTKPRAALPVLFPFYILQ